MITLSFRFTQLNKRNVLNRFCLIVLKEGKLFIYVLKKIFSSKKILNFKIDSLW